MTRGTSQGTVYRRFTTLDGLRGLAALSVVFYHCLLVSPRFGTAGERQSGWTWALAHTPLHLFWQGGEAVYLFFVLSGFVLTLPFDRDAGSSWSGYYPRRIVRLYLPALAALALALLTMLLVNRHAAPGLSQWLNRHDVPITAGRVGHDAALVAGTGWYDSPLWSLQWEVLFSLLLPAYIFAGKVLRRFAAPLAVVVVVASVVGAHQQWDWLIYMPMFAVGVLMAVSRQHLAELAPRIPRSGWWALDVLAVLLLTGTATASRLGNVAVVLPLIGSALTIFLFLEQRRAAAFGDSRVVHWLGVRSFSLYLVHEPIIVSVALALGQSNPWPVLGIALPVSLLVAEVFYRLVEGPSHRLASAVGRRLGDRPRRVRPVTGPVASAEVI